MALIAEILRHRKSRKTYAHTRSGRLVHLTVDEGCLGENSGLLHFVIEVVALAGTLANAGKDGKSAVLGGDIVDKLHDENGLSDSGAAEESDFTALCVGADEVYDLDTGLENLRRALLLIVCGRGSVYRPARLCLGRGHIVHGVAEEVEHSSEALLTHRDGDRRACIDGVKSALQAVGRAHRDATRDRVAYVLHDLAGELFIAVLDRHGVQKIRKAPVLKLDVEDRAENLDYFTYVSHLLTP